ncbi:hypothetical protein Taro_006611 [Colocasia esculenta]|uniref:Uncharacterized protein n=1 Tax=Colocasia esculenta TaxID=4460 RepID=A0A843TSY9_COLES|nr:hypothetical protein [Colocasia esculenta]
MDASDVKPASPQVRFYYVIMEESEQAELQVEEANLRSLSIVNHGKTAPAATEDGSVDRKGNPAIKGRSGGWTSAALLLVNQGLTTLAFFGVGVNLVLFLTRVLQQDNADAANNVSKWTGTVYIFSLIGAFMSDSYWGRYFTCAVFQIIFVLGLALLSLSSWLLLVKPAGCGDGEMECRPVSITGTVSFYISIYLIAFGNGGYLPTIATFGADQFDENDPVEQHSKIVFFSYFYFALNTGSLFSNAVLGYFEDSGQWVIGFWASAASAIAALLLFYVGTPRYRHFKPCGNPLTRITQVLIAASRKWSVRVPLDEGKLYEVEGKESAIAGSRKIRHSHGFRFLDKAATMVDRDYNASNVVCDDNINPWRLCTVTQVEEVKCVLKLLPIWLCTVIYSVVFTQMASLFVEQGDIMNTNVGEFHIPPASMSVFDILSVLVCILLYRRILVPAMGRFCGRPKGLTEFQRMGAGLVIATLAMVAAGLTEIERLRRVGVPEEPSSLSVFWQIPQYALIGASEFFMYVGQLEFFNGQAPDGLKSFGSSLCMASISFGNYASSMLVSIVEKVTSEKASPGWIPRNLNHGHLDRFYFLLAILTAGDFVIYLLCVKWYSRWRVVGNELEKQKDQGMPEVV